MTVNNAINSVQTLDSSSSPIFAALSVTGAITTATWNGAIIGPTYGGTGVNNGTKNITLGGSLATSGAFDSTFTMTGTTTVTFPTSGTLATTTGTVASITGTSNQVFANGTSGAPQTGAITLTLPQNIDTGASPTFNIVTFSSMTSGSVLYAGVSGIVSQDHNYFTYDSTNHHLTLTGTYTAQDGSFNQQAILFNETFAPSAVSTLKSFSIYCTETFNATSGKTITAAGSILIVPNFVNGGGSITTWYGVSSGSNYSGDPANVVNAYSGYFGTPVFGSSSSVALYADNLAIGFGTTSPPSLGAFIRGQTVIGATSANGKALLAVISTTAGFLPPVMNNTQRDAITSPPGGLVIYSTTDTALEFYNGSSWVSGGGGGVTSIAGTSNQINASASTGAVTLTLSSTIVTPGTLSVTGSLTSGSTTTLNATTSYNTVIAGTQIAVDGSSFEIGLYNKPTLNPTNGATTCFGIYNTPIFIAPTGKTITNAYGMQIAPILSSNVGTISVAVTLHLQAGSAPAGTINNNYTLYCQAPTSGVQKYTAYFDAGVGIGDVNLVSSSAALLVSSTTQGFLPPVMNNTQRNAISGPASGLVIYSTTDNDLEFYNGSSWIGSTISGVTTIAGTSNQINASASTGSVILSLSSTIVTPGTFSVNGTLASNTTTSLNATTAINTQLTGTQTAQASATQICLYLTPTLSPSAQIAGAVVSIYNIPTITVPNVTNPAIATIFGEFTSLTVNGAAKTVTNLYSYYVGVPSITTVSVTNAYGIAVFTPTAATSVNTATYTDNLSVGSPNFGTSPPTSGILFSVARFVASPATNAIMYSTNSSGDMGWTTATYPPATTINQILYSSSANVVAGLATANKAVLTTNGSGVPSFTALATNGQIIIGSTAGVPAAATITAGTGITVTNGSNSITIATSGGVSVSFGLIVATASFMNGF